MRCLTYCFYDWLLSGYLLLTTYYLLLTTYYLLLTTYYLLLTTYKFTKRIESISSLASDEP
ncbi:hypothetical protein CWO23_12285 [Vibrio splendidus]|nr:hypothetical protein CWO23_12285 [Vibrio splendidus]